MVDGVKVAHDTPLEPRQSSNNCEGSSTSQIDNLDNLDKQKKFQIALTTRIVGLAAEECGLLGYNPDITFEIRDIIDPEFPLTEADQWPENNKNMIPVQFLEDLCECRENKIITVVEQMERAWTKGNDDKDFDYCGNVVYGERIPQKIANTLWEFAKVEAVHHVGELFGDEYMKEFEILGDKLFGSAI